MVLGELGFGAALSSADYNYVRDCEQGLQCIKHTGWFFQEQKLTVLQARSLKGSLNANYTYKGRVHMEAGISKIVTRILK